MFLPHFRWEALFDTVPSDHHTIVQWAKELEATIEEQERDDERRVSDIANGICFRG